MIPPGIAYARETVMTDDRYMAVLEEGIASREMYLSRLRLLYDRCGERWRPAIVERILDAEAALHRAEARLHTAYAMRSAEGGVDRRPGDVDPDAWRFERVFDRRGDRRRRAHRSGPRAVPADLFPEDDRRRSSGPARSLAGG